MNPPNWHARKPRTCPCDDCHVARYVDLAYAVGKNADTEWEGSPDSYGTEDMPQGDNMSWFDEPYTCEECGKECRGLAFWTQCPECSSAAHAARLAAIRERSPYTVNSLGGMCPTQAEGRTVGGRPYYFRARHGEWTLEVGQKDFPTDYPSWPFNRADWEDFLVASGDDPTHGGMSDEEVLAILDEHLAGR